MPIYEYRCNACGHKLESLQRLSDAPLVTCPACGKDALAKQLSAAGFQLKGSGWYATDFKNSGSKPPAKDAAKPDAKADAPAAASSEASEAKSSDTSTAAKADAPAAPAATKTSDQGKSETRSASDKPAATGTTSGSS
jgi:putative FmdB family regulatory protein